MNVCRHVRKSHIRTLKPIQNAQALFQTASNPPPASMCPNVAQQSLRPARAAEVTSKPSTENRRTRVYGAHTEAGSARGDAGADAAPRGSMSPSPGHCGPAGGVRSGPGGHRVVRGHGHGPGAEGGNPAPLPRSHLTRGDAGAGKSQPRKAPGRAPTSSAARGSSEGSGSPRARSPARRAEARPPGEPALEWRGGPGHRKDTRARAPAGGRLTGDRARGRGRVPKASGAGPGGCGQSAAAESSA
jgi:hypothetical protein